MGTVLIYSFDLPIPCSLVKDQFPSGWGGGEAVLGEYLAVGMCVGQIRPNLLMQDSPARIESRRKQRLVAGGRLRKGEAGDNKSAGVGSRRQ
jgi:hypothetical protein